MTEELGTTLERHIVGLRRYAVALLRDSIEADDLVQECLLRALSRPHVWPQVLDRRAYLFTILHNLFIERRSQYRKYERHISIDDMTRELPVPSNQQERLEVRDFKRALWDLPENYRVVTLLVGLEGMTYREAADILDVPLGTIMSRLSRGRELLRRHMNGESEYAAISKLQESGAGAGSELGNVRSYVRGNDHGSGKRRDAGRSDPRWRDVDPPRAAIQP